VELVYPKHKADESGEVTVEDANFHIPVEFVTAQSSLSPTCPEMWPQECLGPKSAKIESE
jgi:hypothetical protein